MPNADAMEPCIYDFARLLTQEQGKPIERARTEIYVKRVQLTLAKYLRINQPLSPHLNGTVITPTEDEAIDAIV